MTYVVKGLNVGLADVIVNPRCSAGDPDMFIAGESDEANRSSPICLRSSAGR
jgi:hypothetical protein